MTVRRNGAGSSSGAARTVYSFCEPVTQTGTRWHIRAVGADGVHLNGGIPRTVTALCGHTIAGGWDIPMDVTDSAVRGLMDRNAGARTVSNQALCVGCATQWRN
jgi:hypothetical protein